MRRMRTDVLAVVGSVCLAAIRVLADGNATTTNNAVNAGAGVHLVGQVWHGTNAGESIVILLTMKNESSNDVTYASIYPEREFAVTIRDSSGVDVPMTRFGRKVMEARGGGARFMRETLSPGKEVRSCLNIARLYDLSVADKYIVSVARTIDVWVPGKERQVSMEMVLVVQEPKR